MTPLRSLRETAPELFERELVTEELRLYAASLGHGDVVDWLVSQGATLTLAVATALGRVDVVASMLDADPSLVEAELPREVTEEKKHLPWQERSPLAIAASRDWTQIVKLLLARGADVSIRSRDHHNPTAMVMNTPPTVLRDEIRDLLIAHGARPEEQLPHWVVG